MNTRNRQENSPKDWRADRNTVIAQNPTMILPFFDRFCLAKLALRVNTKPFFFKIGIETSSKPDSCSSFPHLSTSWPAD